MSEGEKYRLQLPVSKRHNILTLDVRTAPEAERRGNTTIFGRGKNLRMDHEPLSRIDQTNPTDQEK